jgi:hypothetical protein
VLYLRLIILLVGDDVPIDNDVLLVIDFVNLKIKSDQSFRGDHRYRVCVRLFIRMNAYICMSIYICIVFLFFFENIRLKGLLYGNVKSPL